jgi:hypothetical protein
MLGDVQQAAPDGRMPQSFARHPQGESIMATKKTAELVKGTDLSKMVDKAVAIAAARHQVAVSDTNLIIKWELIGRYLKDGLLADKFAGDVAAELGRAGLAVQPASLRFGRQILCGFFEKVNIPTPRPF